VSGFQRSAAGFEPEYPVSTRLSTARLRLPERSTAPLHLEETTTGASIAVTLAGARDVVGAEAAGYVVYAHAHASGATLLHRALPEGAEDFVSFDERPNVPAIAYQLALGENVRGLRLVANTLEMLDAISETGRSPVAIRTWVPGATRMTPMVTS
jgi:hypothetical protein